VGLCDEAVGGILASLAVDHHPRRDDRQLPLLSAAMRSLPLGTSYMIWTGIGAVGAFVVGVVLLGEPLGALRIGAAVLIVSGLVLMKLSSR
jgi:multidrug transporter EmrE-like cation transporter